MTVVLAYFILKEVLKIFDGAIMAINLAAIMVTIFGGQSGQNDLPTPPFSIYIIYGVMLVNPFLSSGGTIAMRNA